MLPFNIMAAFFMKNFLDYECVYALMLKIILKFDILNEMIYNYIVSII